MVADLFLTPLVIFVLAILAVGSLLRILGQPTIIAYMIVGILMGPHVLGFANESTLGQLGDMGIVMFLFFIGMEISLDKLISNWRVSILGTFFQIAISVFLVWIVGLLFSWPIERIVFLGFMISLSSTAVVLKHLEVSKELNTKVGQDVLGILLVQDLAVIPMLIVLGYLGGDNISSGQIMMQILGGVFFVGLVAWTIHKRELKLPLTTLIIRDHDTEVFVAIAICFGFAFLAGLFGLSTALGAFVAGIIVSNTQATNWIKTHLNPFRAVFVTLFFVYIGTLIDIGFFLENFLMISLLVGIIFATNTFVNAAFFRLLGNEWDKSLYSGSLLSQIGEFSFLLGAYALQHGIINSFGYKTLAVVIAITLLLSPFWVQLVRRLTDLDIQRNPTNILNFGKRPKYKYRSF